jgi:hypothetical protein
MFRANGTIFISTIPFLIRKTINALHVCMTVFFFLQIIETKYIFAYLFRINKKKEGKTT